MASAKEIYELGELPPLGMVPRRMHGSLNRRERFGPPSSSFQMEQVPVPRLGPREVMVYVMAAGINYNNVWTALGERRNPRIVFDHSGEGTIPTSMYVCDTEGMVVVCGGTSGYNGDVDLRFLWMRQERLQGSHFADTQECAAITELVARGIIDPCLSTSASFDQVGNLHQLMYENEHPPGNMAVRVNAREPGQREVAF